jgi:hypothetical protein
MRPASLVAVTLVWCGCGGSSGPSVATACHERATASCALRDTCSAGHGVAARYGDSATCVGREAQACVTNAAAPGTKVTASTITACATALPDQTCTDFLDDLLVAACVPPVGARANGEPCGANGQCQSTYCALPKGAACGQCADLPVQGAACVNTGEVVRGFTCLAATSTWAALGASGGPCGPDTPCQAGLACVGASGSATCQAQGTTLGSSCDSRRESAPDCDRTLGLSCTGHTNGQCAALGYAAAGAPCGRVSASPDGGTSDGGVGFTAVACTGGAVCVIPAGTFTGTCVGPAAEGAACDTDTGPPCLAPARCVGTVSDAGTTSGTCQLLDPAACG